MKINWKVRVKNKYFWISLIAAVLIVIQSILAPFGIVFDYTEINEYLVAIVSAVFGLLTVLGIVVDHTTDGVGDTKLAMSYEKPRKEDDLND